MPFERKFCLQRPLKEYFHTMAFQREFCIQSPLKENFLFNVLSKKISYTTPFKEIFVRNTLSKKLFEVSLDSFWYNSSLIILIVRDSRQKLDFRQKCENLGSNFLATQIFSWI